MTFLRAIMANSGIQNSATTRMDATVRNWAYMGTWSMKKSVSPMKFFPQESMTDSTVAARSAHFTGPFTMKSPSTKSMSTKAPT